MTISLCTKQQARAMRASGASIRDIAEALGVAKSSTSLIVRDVPLSPEALEALASKRAATQMKIAQTLQARRHQREKDAKQLAKTLLNSVNVQSSAVTHALLAAYYWCEGNKAAKDLVVFTNSDPNVIQAFLSLFRKTFSPQEERFRVSLHLHDYHNSEAELAFWSHVTKIPRTQFLQPYRKQHTGTRTREGYHGCVQVRYLDIQVARTLLAMGQIVNAKCAAS